MINKAQEQLVIIGSGPAAHTAAIYAARANLHPLLFEGFMAGGVAAGGQLTTTTEVDNFPGFPEGIMGPFLMERLRAQSLRFGTRIVTQTVQAVDVSKKPFQVTFDSDSVQAHALIVATGATAKRMNLKGEDLYWQHGISACAVCDGSLPLFRQRPVVVVGGGDSACEEALYLSKFASLVHLLVRTDAMRASKTMQNRVLACSKIQVHWTTLAQEALGDGKFLIGVKVRHAITQSERIIEASGLFYAIGHHPNTQFLAGQLELDESGYIKTIPGTSKTSVSGVFAAGDVQDQLYRQAITAAGSGCMAALDAERFLNEQGLS